MHNGLSKTTARTMKALSWERVTPVAQSTRVRARPFRIRPGMLGLVFVLGLLSMARAEDETGSGPPTARKTVAPERQSEPSGTLKDYRISALDVLSVTVFQEPELTREVKVSQTGYITFPLLGKVHLAGLLVSEVENQLATLLGKDYLKNPQVSVSVKEYSARRVSVLGEVKKPGSFDIPAEERMTLLQVVARAEGFTNLAKTDAVVIRRMRGGKEEALEVNATELMTNKTGKKDVDLERGDIVVVPARFF